MKRRFGNFSITAAALSTVVVLSACGSDSKNSDTAANKAATTTSSAAATSTAETSTPAAPGAAKLVIAKDAKLGEILTDGSGFTLYRFDKDGAKPPTSACTGDCTKNWPPAIATGKPEVTGIDAALVGTFKRADGAEQITIDGWPLYRFAPDAAAGETKGQGVGGVWWAVTPKGAKAGAADKPAGSAGY